MECRTLVAPWRRARPARSCFPSERHTPWNAALWWLLGGELVQHVLVFQVPDLDGNIGSSHQPVVLRREGEGIDGATGVQRVEVLAIVDIPEHHAAVLATRGA